MYRVASTSAGGGGGLRSSVASHTSHGSNLSTAFVHMTAPQIRFFDRVIDHIDASATDFASLKRAYHLVRQKSADLLGELVDTRTDTALWEILLHLAHVRGRSWSQRWDAVRITLGLEPRFTSDVEEDMGYDDESAASSTEQDHLPRPYMGSRIEESWRGMPSTAKRYASTSNPRPVRRDSPSPPESPSLAASQRRQRQGVSPDGTLEALRARMAALTARANQLASSLNHGSDGDEEISPEDDVPLHAHPASILRSTSAPGRRLRPQPGRPRKLRFASSDQLFDPRTSLATRVESATDEEEAERVRAPTAYSTRPTYPTRSEPRPPLLPLSSPTSTPVKRRFDEVVARSRVEREAARQMAEVEREAAQEARMAPLYRHADRFCTVSLLRKSFHWWFTLHQRRILAVDKAENQRNYTLQGKALAAWRSTTQHHHHRDRQAAKVDLIRCKLRAWRTWTRKVRERRRQEREEKRELLRGAFEVTVGQVEARIVKEALHRWQQVHQVRKALAFRHEHLLRGAMSLWRIATWQAGSMHAKEVTVMEQHQHLLLQLAFRRWLDLVRQRQMAVVAQSYDRERTLHACLLRWSTQTTIRTALHQKEALADRWHVRRVKQHTLQHWQSLTVAQTQSDKTADNFYQALLLRRQADLFRHWMLKERQVLFVHICSQRRLRHLFSHWQTRNATLRQSLGKREDALLAHHEEELVRQALLRWHGRLQVIVDHYVVAVEFDGQKIISEAWAVWRAAAQRLVLHRHRAETFDRLQLQRRALSVWIERQRKARLDRLLAQKDRNTAHEILLRWHQFAQQRRREFLAVARMQNRSNRRTRAQVLRHWTERTIERKAAVLEAAEARDQIVLARAWQLWLRACDRHEDLFNLANSFRDVQREDRMRKAFALWSSLARAQRHRRETAEMLVQCRAEQIKTAVWERWYERYVESTLHEQEVEAFMQRQANVKRAVLTRWMERSQQLPAVQFDHIRLKARAWQMWRAKLPLARLEGQARRHDRLGMQAKAFDHWLRMAKTKRAFRAAARFGGPSAVQMRAARRRSSGPGGSGGHAGSGGAFGGGGGRPARRRNRSSLEAASRPDDSVNPFLEGAQPSGGRSAIGMLHPTSRPPIDLDVSSLRESDLVSDRTRVATALDRRHDHIATATKSLAQLTIDDASAKAMPRTEAETGQSTTAPAPPALQRWMRGVQRAPLPPLHHDERPTLHRSQSTRSEMRSPTRRTRSPAAHTDGGRYAARWSHTDEEGEQVSTSATVSPAMSRAQSEAMLPLRRRQAATPARQIEGSARPIPTITDLLRSRRGPLPLP